MVDHINHSSFASLIFLWVFIFFKVYRFRFLFLPLVVVLLSYFIIFFLLHFHIFFTFFHFAASSTVVDYRLETNPATLFLHHGNLHHKFISFFIQPYKPSHHHLTNFPVVWNISLLVPVDLLLRCGRLGTSLWRHSDVTSKLTIGSTGKRLWSWSWRQIT